MIVKQSLVKCIIEFPYRLEFEYFEIIKHKSKQSQNQKWYKIENLYDS